MARVGNSARLLLTTSFVDFVAPSGVNLAPVKLVFSNTHTAAVIVSVEVQNDGSNWDPLAARELQAKLAGFSVGGVMAVNLPALKDGGKIRAKASTTSVIYAQAFWGEE